MFSQRERPPSKRERNAKTESMAADMVLRLTYESGSVSLGPVGHRLLLSPNRTKAPHAIAAVPPANARTA